MFPETCAIARACAGTHASKFTCAIHCMGKFIIFSLFILLLLYISHNKKFLIEGFFIEYYMQEMQNVINGKIL